jgi:hypothetical protein
MTVQDDDQLLVCRNTTPYTLKSQNVMAELLDDDLMLVCRNGSPYKATGLEIKESIGPQEAPPSLTSVVLTEDSPGGDRFDNQSFTSTLSWATKGIPEASLEMKATVTGTLDIAGATDEIVGIEGGTSSFAPVLYTGNDGTQSFDLGFAPAFVWQKCRTRGDNHCLFDVVRGNEKRLLSNTPDQQYDVSDSTTFNSNGFSIGSNNEANRGGEDYVAWCWDAGDTTVTNDDGDIESQVRSNGSFSIVSYTGTGQNSATIGHGLNTAPSFIILKTINQTVGWPVYHTSTGINGYLGLNDSFGFYSATAYTNVNDTTFTTGNDGWIQPATNSFIAYCWAESPTQKFGSYTGTSTSNPIDCGFEPAFVLIKNSSESGEQWHIYDNARSTTNPRNKVLFPNLSNAEDSDALYDINFTSSGFELLTSNAGINASGRTYIYAAFGSGSPNTTLTLASDANLANGAFKAGDVVKQNNSPIVPTSSEITNVGEVGTARLFTSSTAPANLADALTKTEVTYQSQVNLGIGEYLIIVPEYNATGQVFTTNGTANFSYNSGSSADIGSFESDGTALGGYGSYNDLEWVAQNYTTDPSVDLTSTAYVIPSYAGGYTVFEIGTAGTTGVISGATSLTLQNASGLSDFEVGDVAKQEPKSVLTELLYSVDIGSGGRPGVADRTSQFNSTKQSIPLATGTFDTPAISGSIMLDIGSEDSTLDWTFTVSSGTYAGTWFAGNDLINWVDSGITASNGTLRELKGYRYWWYNENTNGVTNNFSGTLLGQSTGIVNSIGPGNTLTLGDTDGIWSAGASNYATGPEKAITATYVSSDPSVPSMTVSDVVGPWSANTGNYVVNTVVNPVLIKPETSAIADVDEVVNNYTSNLTANQPWSTASPITNAFDGDCYTLAALDSGAADATITWDASSYNFSTENGNVVVRSATANVQWKATGSTGASTVQSVSDPAGGALPAVGILQKLEIIGPAASLMCVRVGGVILTDDSLSTTLTLSDDTDLNQFATGDNVYAAGGGGPSGVVGDITGLDMTLSESTGTWEVGQKVTMDEKPAISTTANLIFDSTGAVTGLSTQPVAGQLVSNKDTPKLTFGDGAGTGETWDEELPAGTRLQTSFVATNVEGTTSGTSNEITP